MGKSEIGDFGKPEEGKSRKGEYPKRKGESRTTRSGVDSQIFAKEVQESQERPVTFEPLTAENVGAVKKLFDNAFPEDTEYYNETDFCNLINQTDGFTQQVFYVARLSEDGSDQRTESGADPYIAFRWGVVASGDSPGGEGQGFAYIPYGGVDSNFRGKTIYPQICAETEQLFQEQFDVHTFVNDVERPQEYEITGQTSDEERTKIKRIAFFQNKLEYAFIDPAYVETHRPGWGEEGSKRDEDNTEYLLGFTSRDEQGIQTIENEGVQYITKADARELYRSFLLFNKIAPDVFEEYVSYRRFMEAVDQLDGDLVPLLPKVKIENPRRKSL